MAAAATPGTPPTSPRGGATSSFFDGLEPNDNYSRYLIIGAGLSGLSAAAHLGKLGHRDFKILEARQRVGGRVMTVRIGDVQAELGANWIHGILGNPLYELAVSEGLLDTVQTPRPHNVVAVSEDGRRLPFSVLQETYEAYFWFFKRCEEYFLCKYTPPQGVNSVGEHMNLEINIYLKRFPLQQRHIRRLVFDYLMKRECCITGSDTMNDVDLVGIGSYTELPGGNITLPRGFNSLISPLMAHIKEDQVLKGHAVKQIHWKYRLEMENQKNDKGYESEGNDSDSSVKTVKSAKDKEEGSPPIPGSPCSSIRSSCAPSVCATPMHKRSYPNVLVECENGSKFYADHVICTLPLGILKEKHTSIFSPELPPEKVKAIDTVKFGTVNKIFLEYDRPFLSPDITEIILLWDKVDEEKLPMKEKWYRKIYSFSKLSETVLLGWITGEEARFMEGLKMNSVAETCTAILRKFLADPYVPKPKACVFTAWYSQPYSRGSYSFLGSGSSQQQIEKIAAPLFLRPLNKSPVVVFAGEHCHPSFYSTAHGAFLSGRSAAQFFLTVVKKQEEEDEEQIYNLSAASVADLSSWLEEISTGKTKLEDYKKKASEPLKKAADGSVRSRRDDGQLSTPR